MSHMNDDFQLHPQLAADTFTVLRLDTCRVLLQNDARYPWYVLVPERPGLSQLHELAADDYVAALAEVRQVAAAVNALPGVERVNVAALGNVVPQLHIHVIGRSTADAAWPRPVWGIGSAVPYAPQRRDARIQAMRAALAAR